MNINTTQIAGSVSNWIDAILAVLGGKIPFDTNLVPFPENPIEFIMSLLKQVVGYDELVEFLSETVVYGIPLLESAMKISVIESLKDLFSCSINPILSEDIINQGVVLDLTTIDLMNIMNRCPLGSENGKYKLNGSFFYSDVEGFTIPEELEKCKDLNAVIWFVKNKAIDRVVWYGYQNQDTDHEILTRRNGASPGTMPSVKDGIITLEYVKKASELTDSMGNSPLHIQVPHDNCLHVFLGNAKGIAHEEVPSYQTIASHTSEFNALIENLQSVLADFKNEYANTGVIEEQAALQCSIEIVEGLLEAIDNGTPIQSLYPSLPIDNETNKRYINIGGVVVYLTEYTYAQTKNELAEENKQFKTDIRRVVTDYEYRTPQENYYYHKTLFEFNTDYIMSLKFFDPTVLISQIIDILTGCFTALLNLSFEELLIRNEVKKMLKNIIERQETTTVSDCFYTFTNDEYNIMVDKTEMERVGRYTGDEYGYGTKIDYNLIYSELDQVANSATLSEQVSAITRTVNTISQSIQPEGSNGFDLSVDFGFLNNLLSSLTLSMVFDIISPKIYMLMAINLKLMGKAPNFDITTFLEKFKTLLMNAIQSIVDELIAKMKEWLISLIKELVLRLADRLLTEQTQCYINLLMSCLRAYRRIFGNEDWNMTNVEYADIIPENGDVCGNNALTAVNNKC